jgi:predicted O-methyltransferase YrrM
LHAGVQLKIFSVIADNRLRAEEVAERLDASYRGISMLLDALAAMGLLVKRDSLFANTPEGQRLLREDSPGYVGHIILHHYHLVPAWSQLPKAVAAGRPVRHRFSFGEAQERESFLMGMYNLAMEIAPVVSTEIDLKGKEHLLDLGGGPGTYAIHFCLAHPGLRATVYDLPTTQPFAVQTIERFGLRDRIGFVAGDYVNEEIRGTYDVAWLSHILHGEGPEECEKIVKKTASAIKEGGLILVHDFILDDNGDKPLFPALFSLNMLINTDKGQAYTWAQIGEMLKKAGAKKIRRLGFRGPNDSAIMQAEL